MSSGITVGSLLGGVMLGPWLQVTLLAGDMGRALTPADLACISVLLSLAPAGTTIVPLAKLRSSQHVSLGCHN